MEISKDFMKDVFENRLVIDCIKIKIQQRIEQNPFTYSAPGEIYQDKNGKLKLKIITTYEDIKKEMSSFNNRIPIGKLIPESEFYDLEAIDVKGNSWKAKNIDIDKNNYLNTNCIVINAKINELYYEEEREKTETDYIFAKIDEELDIPFNKVEKKGALESHLNTCEIEYDKVCLIIKKSDGNTIINIHSSEQKLDENYYIKIKEVLQILTGIVFTPKIIKISTGKRKIWKIRSDYKVNNKNKFPEPIKIDIPYQIDGFKKFIEEYTKLDKNKCEIIYGFWYKMNRAWQAEIETAALSLTVGIEGLLREFFKEKGKISESISSEADSAKEEIQKLKLNSKIEKWIIGSLENLINNPSPKAMLNSINNSEIITKKMKTNWNKLRNTCAHATIISNDNKEFQKLLDRFYSCVSLFYIIIFIIIRYDCKYINYSKDGWPEETMKVIGK
ncbi:hypothetical protein D4R71_08575 [bacterium]|nr:MAG: hypothetical protein D4R71_08575 [bacterium]